LMIVRIASEKALIVYGSLMCCSLGRQKLRIYISCF
jgi:hypothetical protein